MTDPVDGGPVSPRYGSTSLAEVMPSAAAALGVPGYPVDPLGLRRAHPDASRVVVVLVDGLGWSLLESRWGHAPYLRSRWRDHPAGIPPRLTAAFPTTTATGLATLGTGRPPGRHGLVGYEVLDPDRDRVVSQLHWPDDLDPLAWQPHPTVFEDVAAAGVAVHRVGPRAFDGSGLTAAGLRGGAYLPAETLPERVDAVLRVLARPEPALVYLYWGQLDRTGHDKGCESLEWTRELEELDSQLAHLGDGAPPGTLVVVTADHGMVDVPLDRRIDLASRPDLLAGVRHAGGDPRALYLWTGETGRDEVVDRWQQELGDSADVVVQDDAVRRGWFGPDPEPRVRRRIGDVVVVVRDRLAVVDSSRYRPELLRLVGLHGALTNEELMVPLLLDRR